MPQSNIYYVAFLLKWLDNNLTLLYWDLKKSTHNTYMEHASPLRNPEDSENFPPFLRFVHTLREVGNTAVFRVRNLPDELFLRFCANVLEKPERSGKLPIAYSTLSLEQARTVVTNARDQLSLAEAQPDDASENNAGSGVQSLEVPVETAHDDQQFELQRVQELAELVAARQGEVDYVRSEADILNPLGNLEAATIVFTADDHQPPSHAIEGTRSYAFGRYFFQRIPEGIGELFKQEHRWGSSGRRGDVTESSAGTTTQENGIRAKLQRIKKTLRLYVDLSRQFRANPEYASDPDAGDTERADVAQTAVGDETEGQAATAAAEVLTRRFVQWQEVRALFREWMTEVIASPKFHQNRPEGARTILFSLGDLTNDGGFLIDAIDAERQKFEIVDEIEWRLKSAETAETNLSNRRNIEVKAHEAPLRLGINGNHDLDSRIPESAGLLAELVGHRIFVQDIGPEGKKVRVVALDTNILSPAWCEIFRQHAQNDTEALAALDQKFKLQEAAIHLMLEHRGPVVLVGHHPSRIIDALAIQAKILQDSGVVMIVAGHTHQEDHIKTPIKNADGVPIAMHVLDSTSKSDSKGMPLPPKMYALDITEKVGQLETVQQPPDAFQARHKRYISELGHEVDLTEEM